MNIEKIKEESLRIDYKVIIPAEDVNSKIDEWLRKKTPSVRLPGYRVGKAPLERVRSLYFDEGREKVLEHLINHSVKEIISKDSPNLASKPKFQIESFSDKDPLILLVSMDLVPEFSVSDIGSNVSFEKINVETSEEDARKTLEAIAKDHLHFKEAEENYGAQENDRVTVSVKTEFKGKPLKNYSTSSLPIIMEPSSWTLDFLREGLMDAKKGQVISLTHSFTEAVEDPFLKGKKVLFVLKVLKIEKGEKLPLSDELAKDFNCQTLDEFKEKLKKEIEQEREPLLFLYHKRQILDSLDKIYGFELPSSLVEKEYSMILNRLKGEMTQEEWNKEDKEQIEKEYRKISERRVRLGLVINKIAQTHTITVDTDSIKNAIIQETKHYPGREKEVINFYKNNADALRELTSPILENKVIKFILESYKTEPTKITPEEFDKRIKDIIPENITHHKHDDSCEHESCDHELN